MHNSNARQLLLEDLFKLSANHADYGGTVELENEKYRLRYYPNPEPWMVEEQRENWNRGVRELEQIAPRVIDYLRRKGVDSIDAETKGASVMAWVLRPWFVGNRSSASAVSSAFSAIREAIIMLDASPVELTNELYLRLYKLVQMFHRQGHVRFYVTQSLDDGLTEKHVESYSNLYRSEFRFLNEHLSVVAGYPTGLRRHPALADYVTRTMARARSDLLPSGFDTFADEAIARFEKCKGLYLRLAESIALQNPIDRKYADDFRLWREFDYDDDFSKLLSGLKWERATILEMLPVSSEKMQTQDDPVLQFLRQLYELRHKAGLLRRDFIDLNEVQMEREKLSQIASEILEPAYKRWAAVAIGRFGADPDSWAIVADELHKELQDDLSKLPNSVRSADDDKLQETVEPERDQKIDLGDYVLFSEIKRNHLPNDLVVGDKRLRSFIEAEGIRHTNPTPQRLYVHLGDFVKAIPVLRERFGKSQDDLDDETAQRLAAVQERKRQSGSKAPTSRQLPGS